MPRIRSIKPSFFQSDDVSALPLRARLTWIGLWTHCDDAGRTKDHARLIKAAIWPLDNVSLADIEQDLETLAGHGRIVRYEVDGQRYLAIVNWDVHQSIQKKTPSRIPAPPNGYTNGHVALREDSGSGIAGKGEEGKGREGTRARDAEVAPSPKCPDHANTRNPPKCGSCADARKELARWEADHRARIAAGPKCRVHRGEPRDNCGLCRSEELAPA